MKVELRGFSGCAFRFLNAKCESAFLAERNPRQINRTGPYRLKHQKTPKSPSRLSTTIAHSLHYRYYITQRSARIQGLERKK
uniref:Large ribosomal subunit protein eL24-related N-terminal domain-containing protein n=1 Tax=Salarias fasciatus TaxID=181472 RepID=A0A672GEF7_SALFA